MTLTGRTTTVTAKPVLASQCPPKAPQKLAWDRHRASAVRSDENDEKAAVLGSYTVANYSFPRPTKGKQNTSRRMVDVLAKN